MDKNVLKICAMQRNTMAGELIKLTVAVQPNYDEAQRHNTAADTAADTAPAGTAPAGTAAVVAADAAADAAAAVVEQGAALTCAMLGHPT